MYYYVWMEHEYCREREINIGTYVPIVALTITLVLMTIHAPIVALTITLVPMTIHATVCMHTQTRIRTLEATIEELKEEMKGG